MSPPPRESGGQGAKDRSGFLRVAENVSWLVGERSLLLVLNFVVSVWFINYLGPSLYGKYAYAVSFATLFATLATLGLNNIVIRELSRSADDHGQILGTAFVMRLGSSAITFGLIAIAIFLVSDDPTTRLLVLVVAVSVTRWTVRRKTRRALGRLERHHLKDIGMTPEQAWREAALPFWLD